MRFKSANPGVARRVLLTVCLVCLSLGWAGCLPASRLASGPGAGAASPSVRPGHEYFVYHVQPGDTLYQLGDRFRVPWKQIVEENDIKDLTTLRVGQVLLIPRVEGVEVPEAADNPPQPAGPRPPVLGAAPRRPVAAGDLHRGNSSSRFWWPTKGTVVRRYGDVLRGLPEPGIAIAAPAGTEVCAVDAGTVVTCIRIDDSGGMAWGNVVAIAHPGDWVSWYAHLDRILVEKAGKVKKGEPIGTVGATGAADRPQLALRLFRNERFVDPEKHMP